MIAIFLFYDKGIEKPSRYTTNGIKHCNLIYYDGRDYIFAETSKKGISLRVLRITNSKRLIHHLHNLKHVIKIISVTIDWPAENKWLPLWIRSCNELCRYISGIDVGLTFNPTHLIKKLIKYDRLTNYRILYEWSISGG